MNRRTFLAALAATVLGRLAVPATDVKAPPKIVGVDRAAWLDEDALVIYRLVRQPDRNIIVLDIPHPPSEADLAAFKARMRAYRFRSLPPDTFIGGSNAALS